MKSMELFILHNEANNLFQRNTSSPQLLSPIRLLCLFSFSRRWSQGVVACLHLQCCSSSNMYNIVFKEHPYVQSTIKIPNHLWMNFALSLSHFLPKCWIWFKMQFLSPMSFTNKVYIVIARRSGDNPRHITGTRIWTVCVCSFVFAPYAEVVKYSAETINTWRGHTWAPTIRKSHKNNSLKRLRLLQIQTPLKTKDWHTKVVSILWLCLIFLRRVVEERKRVPSVYMWVSAYPLTGSLVNVICSSVWIAQWLSTSTGYICV